MSKSKLSLAETMELAKIAIEDSSKIVIDRVDSISGTPQSSRKRAKRSNDQSSSEHYYRNSLNNSSTTNPYDYDEIGTSTDWRDRLVSILKGKDEDIQDLREQLDVAEVEAQRLKDMCSMLESRLKSFSTMNSHYSDSKTSYASTSSSASNQQQNHQSIEISASTNSSQEIQKLRNIISFYEKLTCMSVKPSLDEEHKYICTVKNHIKRTAIKFELESVMSTEILFRPIANIHHFPEYLHGEISFEAAMAPVMMGDILQGLYNEDHNG